MIFTHDEQAADLSVSVVVATFNRGALLPSLLRDLERQTLGAEDFEVVIVDDGSKEPVRPVVEAHRGQLRLTLLEQANTGQAGARDRGIREASGQIIVIVDDDMELAPDFLEAHVAQHRLGYRVVLGLIRPAANIGAMPIFERFHAERLDKMVKGFNQGSRPRGVHLCTGNVSLRKADYLEVGGFDKTLKRSEDRELGIRLEAAGKSFVYAERAATVHDSDHTDLGVWLKRAFNYGVYDTKINQRHPHVDNSNPWRFLFLVNPISRPLLLSSVLLPQFGDKLSSAVMSLSLWLDERGQEGLALKGTTLVYGLEYFRGIRQESGSVGNALSGLLAYWRTKP